MVVDRAVIMNTYQEAVKIIHQEIVSDDPDDRRNFLRLFSKEEKSFTEAMANAAVSWQELDESISSNKDAYVSGLVHTAITLHISSMKLLLAGHVVASGNLLRQVVEAMCMALLCANKDLPFLAQFMADNYSSNKAVKHARKHWKKLGLNDGAHEQLKMIQDFYHNYSHISLLTLANHVSSSGGRAYVGAAFDPGKTEAYKEEVSRRLRLARVFNSFVEGVKRNHSAWTG